MINRFLAGSIASAALLFGPHSQGAESIALPETAPGLIATKLLEAVNSADAGAAERFATDFIVENPWRQMTREKYRSMLLELREQSGDLKVERVMMSDDRNLRVMIASAKAAKRAGLEIVLPEKERRRASWIWIHHFPGKGAADLPREKMSQSEQADAIQKYLDESAALKLHSGAVLAARGDEILVDRAWGYANLETKIPNTTRMQYGTASVGKMFTAVAIAQLHQAEKLEYTDTIAKHLPDYPNKEAAQKVRISHLLEHSGGIGDPFDSPKLTNSHNYRLQSDYFETFAEKPLAFEPGERHEYSNGGYIVLAAIVEKISGQKFTEYLREYVFEPAGMRQTGLTTATEKLPVSIPHAITVTDDPLGLNGPQPKAASKIAEDGVGMGGWTSTTADLFKFARALRTYKFLDEVHTREITNGKIQFIPKPMNVKYCYGFYEIPVSGDRLVGHSGGGGDLGVGAEVEMLWDGDYTIVILSNTGLEEARRNTHVIARFLAAQTQTEIFRSAGGN